MRDDGVRRALAFVTSPFGSYSSCRQYLDDIERRGRRSAPMRRWSTRSGTTTTIPAMCGPSGTRYGRRTADSPMWTRVRLVFTAHSIPSTMEETSGPDGHRYLRPAPRDGRAGRLAAGVGLDWDLVWQSRSGPPHVPWLEPDINDHLAALATAGVRGVVVCPIGFSSDHLEVAWDLDTEAAATAEQLGLRFARAATPGNDPGSWPWSASSSPNGSTRRRPRPAWAPCPCGTPAPPPAAPPRIPTIMNLGS